MSPAGSKNAPEAKAREKIDALLVQAGWLVQDREDMNLTAADAIAVREFRLEKGHGYVDYLLFLDGNALGVVEAKPAGYSFTITVAVRTALDRIIAERPGIGQAYLFPSPKDRSKPVSKDLASYWLKTGEGLAKVDKQDGSLWHAFRRLWVTARKHLPDVDVARAGGWKDLSVLRNSYQRPDDETILAVVEGGRELRENHA